MQALDNVERRAFGKPGYVGYANGRIFYIRKIHAGYWEAYAQRVDVVEGKVNSFSRKRLRDISACLRTV